MFAAYRMRKVFRHGAATYGAGRRISESHGIEMVDYLRARRAVADPQPSRFISYAMKNKQFARSEYLKKWRRPP